MKTIIMIALIAMSISCVKEEIKPKNVIFVGDSISQTLTSGGDTLYEASSREWYTTDRYGDSTCYSIDVKYVKYVKSQSLEIRINHSGIYDKNKFMDCNIYYMDDISIILSSSNQWFNIPISKGRTFANNNHLVKIMFGGDGETLKDIELPDDMCSIFVEFFDKVEQNEDKK